MLLVADFSYKTKKRVSFSDAQSVFRAYMPADTREKQNGEKKKIGKRAGGMLGACQSLAKPEAAGMRLK